MKITSKKPGKQRKALFNYKNHQRAKLISTKVADFLRDEYGIKRLPLRVGDQVKVCKGEFKDFEGEVLEIIKNQRAKIKECQFEKADGTQFNPSIHISKLVLTKLGKEKKLDPWRASMIERKALYVFSEEELVAPKKLKEEEKK